MAVVELTKENFDAEVMMAKEPVLIDFWASWCGPCMMQSPIVDEIAEEMKGQVKVCKCNVDEEPMVAMEYGIASIPTLVFMNRGVCENRAVGLQSKASIVEHLKGMV